jgi:V8-like Glu-specific endopeptidase
VDAAIRRIGADRLAPELPRLGVAWTRGTAVARTTGKIFFTLAGVDYVCSGSAVTSADASTVATAGHCVNEGPGGYASRLMFVPGYRAGTAPYGTFVATAMATTDGWAARGDFDVDVAFVNVGRNESGRLLTDAVGGQQIGFSRPRGGATYIFGYPADTPYDGEQLDYCSGALLQDTYFGSPDQGLACAMTPGSSGGPWLASFDPATGHGVLVSVTSFGYTDVKSVLWGPYLGSVAQTLFDTVSVTTSR